MVTSNLVYENEEQLQNFIQTHNIKDTPHLLIQVYSGIVKKAFIQTILDQLHTLFPRATIVGATTAGEIVDSKIYEKSVAISFTHLQTTTIQKKHVYYTDFPTHQEAGRYLKENIVSDRTKFVLLLADGIHTNGEELVKGFGESTNIVIGGGLAGDYGTLRNTYVFLQNHIIENGAVALAFDSDVLQVFNYYTTGWKPIGKAFLVTKSIGNIVYELDNMPIYEVYKSYLGEEIAKNLPDSAIEFPLMVEKNGIYIARAAIGMNDEKALIFAGNVPEGSIVRFGFGNSLIILDTAGKLVRNEIFKKRFESLYIFSCVARKRFLGSLIEHEIRPLKKISPNIGFFTYGEFVTMKDGHELLNESLTLVATTENSSTGELNLFDGEYVEENAAIRAINALMQLVEKTTKELEQERLILRNKAQRDGLTGVLNKKSTLDFLNANLHKEQLSLLFLDLDNFKEINDKLGHMQGDEVLKDVAQILQKHTRKSDIVGRFGGEEFIVIYNDTDAKSAVKKAEDIRKSVEKLSQKYQMPITVSIGVTQKRVADETTSILERADEALYFSKRGGKNRVTEL